MVISEPIAFALGISSVVTLIFTEKMPLNFIAQGMFTTVDSYSLMAVPLFVFAGLIMEYGGLTRWLFIVAQSFVGHFIGGLTAVSLISRTIFAELSRSE